MSKKNLNTAILDTIKQLYGQKPADFNLPELSERLSNLSKTVPERTLRRWLNEWTKQGLLRKIGKKRGTRYQVLTPLFQTKTPSFLHNIEPAKRDALLAQLRDHWTHASTAIEGNTLSLGDTHSILELGLTISGKPLREHHEVVGHAKAIDLIYQISSTPLTKQHIFDLHKAVQLEIVMDIYAPVGAWKVEKNFSNSMTSNNKPVIIEYADPVEIDELMAQFIDTINHWDINTITTENAHQTYAKLHLAFVHIHPFADGNGRLARLLANLPLLKTGLPPLLIDQNQRRDYITLLADYQTNTQTPSLAACKNKGLWPEPEKIGPFSEFCARCYQATVKLLDESA